MSKIFEVKLTANVTVEDTEDLDLVAEYLHNLQLNDIEVKFKKIKETEE